MVTSSCPKYGSNAFECVEATIKGLDFRHNFVQCAQCGAVVGILDYYNLGNILRKIADKLGIPR